MFKSRFQLSNYKNKNVDTHFIIQNHISLRNCKVLRYLHATTKTTGGERFLVLIVSFQCYKIKCFECYKNICQKCYCYLTPAPNIPSIHNSATCLPSNLMSHSFKKNKIKGYLTCKQRICLLPRHSS